MTRPRHFLRHCLALLLITTVLPEASSAVEIDASQGEIDGRVAVAFWASEGLESRKILDPDGLDVMLVPSTDLDRELAFPAGSWFQPPIGRYKFWLEGSGWISPYSSVFKYSAEPFRGKGVVAILPVVPAGVVVLDPGAATSSAAMTLRLLHLESHTRAPFPQKEFSRRVRASNAQKGVLVPEGPVVAALFDDESGEYLAISRPFTVERTGATRTRPRPPEGSGTDLLVRLERPRGLSAHGEYELDLFVQTAQQDAVKPDVLVPTADRVYAIWYGLESKHVTLDAHSGAVFLPPQEIVLRAGKVETYYGRLRPLPSVDVRLDLPSGLTKSDEVELSIVSRWKRSDSLREATLRRDTRSFKLENVPAKPIEVVLDAAPWTFRRPADLSDGEDKTVFFEPSPITISGTVFRGDREHPAIVEFETNRKGDVLSVATDENGEYQALLFRAGHFVARVHLEGVEAPPYVELLDHPVREDTTLDFRIPDNAYRVRVLDRLTGQGISGAEVSVGNKYSSGGGSDLRAPGRNKTVAQRIVTDQSGVGRLQPLRSGTFSLRAKAEGYFPSEPLEEVVVDGEREREITLRLHPVDQTFEIFVRLPSGAPAAYAEARLQASLGNTLPSWTGAADVDGRLLVPHEPDPAFLLVRHQEAGGLIHRLETSAESLSWSLPSSAAPLAIRAKRPWGDPAPWAGLALWIGNQCVTGRTLAWLSRAKVAVTDEAGSWEAHHLPAASLKILAWPRGEATNPNPLESLAVDVKYPWHDSVEITTLN